MKLKQKDTIFRIFDKVTGGPTKNTEGRYHNSMITIIKTGLIPFPSLSDTFPKVGKSFGENAKPWSYLLTLHSHKILHQGSNWQWDTKVANVSIII